MILIIILDQQKEQKWQSQFFFFLQLSFLFLKISKIMYLKNNMRRKMTS